eukprot:TRINITY_DN2443_c0_g2_i1.p1 TRINITY_DN2443_c0_g2~~TRINITY_DN2443_c0_g2_i1.p1  ORF type:complete len:327 (+),score=84.17 TRINITY_DN2443_c0_g2_i1:214-1194(+)
MESVDSVSTSNINSNLKNSNIDNYNEQTPTHNNQIRDEIVESIREAVEVSVSKSINSEIISIQPINNNNNSSRNNFSADSPTKRQTSTKYLQPPFTTTTPPVEKKERTASCFSCFSSIIENCMRSLKPTPSPNRNRKSNHRRKRQSSGSYGINRGTLVRIKVGWEGKETRLSSEGLNITRMFGSFAVLLDSHNHIVPLNKEGFPVEPLTSDQRYLVMLNTAGSSKKKWDSLKRQSKRDKDKDIRDERLEKRTVEKKVDIPRIEEIISIDLSSESIVVQDQVKQNESKQERENEGASPDSITYLDGASVVVEQPPVFEEKKALLSDD